MDFDINNSADVIRNGLYVPEEKRLNLCTTNFRQENHKITS